MDSSDSSDDNGDTNNLTYNNEWRTCTSVQYRYAFLRLKRFKTDKKYRKL